MTAKHHNLRRLVRQPLVYVLIIVLSLAMAGCGAFNLGKLQLLVRTPSDEHFWLVKDIYLTPGSAYDRTNTFDHAMDDSVNLVFIPRNERNHYIAKSKWIDPSGQEYRVMRTTYDVQQENKTGQKRNKKGTTRVHHMSTAELAKHEPGLWKVSLYLDDELVRTLAFTVR
jgi:hypothetical protein